MTSLKTPDKTQSNIVWVRESMHSKLNVIIGIAGVYFFPQKSWRPFLVVALKTQAKLLHKPLPPTKSPPPSKKQKKCPQKLTLALPKKFSPPWGVQLRPLHHLATPMTFMTFHSWLRLSTYNHTTVKQPRYLDISQYSSSLCCILLHPHHHQVSVSHS